MPNLVTAVNQVEENIANYHEFLKGHVELQDRTSQNRAWYAIKLDGVWTFGNSKIIGYTGLTPDEYLSGVFDGRQTEAVLQKWFTEVGPGNALFDILWKELADYLSQYRKSPSKLARINVLTSELSLSEDEKSNLICDLIVAVAKEFDDETLKNLRKRLNALP